MKTAAILIQFFTGWQQKTKKILFFQILAQLAYWSLPINQY